MIASGNSRVSIIISRPIISHITNDFIPIIVEKVIK